jgi:hypothetical protein
VLVGNSGIFDALSVPACQRTRREWREYRMASFRKMGPQTAVPADWQIDMAARPKEFLGDVQPALTFLSAAQRLVLDRQLVQGTH